MDAQLIAIVAEGKSGRVYISPNDEHEAIAKSVKPIWYPDGQISDDRRSMFTPLYGLTHFHHLFTPRQLLALTTLSDLVTEAREKIKADALAAGIPDDGLALNDGGLGATAYADAVATYLGLAVDRLADRNSAICTWDIGWEKIRNTFARQAIPMTWDFAEANPMSDSTGNFNGAIDWIVQVIKKSSCSAQGKVIQLDATAQRNGESRLISTDPPYYDNIGYADLADFFYVWLRCSLNPLYPDIFSTLLVPKAPELVATPYRFGGDKEKAQSFFEEGLGKAFTRMNEMACTDYPLTVYYAFKQAETEESDDEEGNTVISSTGWETMLEGLIKSDFSIDGTWPMRSELSNRMVASGTNALASSIVLVCRPRPSNAPKATRRQFLNELKSDLPRALKLLQQGNIAPVDLAQASIGPGMAIFSKYTAVLESNGSPMPVRTALQLINQILDEFLTEQEGEFDSDTRWALTWFEQYQFNQGQYGDAETLSKAKNTSVQGMVEAGILEAKAGKVRLLKREDLKADWNPETDARTPVWEVAQQLIHALDQKGETGAAQLLAKLGTDATLARELAYRLYNLCDRKGWTQEGIAYNSLVTSWSEITRLANSSKHDQSKDQLSLF
jgi:putative DNA methylase